MLAASGAGIAFASECIRHVDTAVDPCQRSRHVLGNLNARNIPPADKVVRSVPLIRQQGARSTSKPDPESSQREVDNASGD